MKRRTGIAVKAFCVVVLLLLVVAIPVKQGVKHQLYPQKFKPEVMYWAKVYELDPNLIFAFIKTESGFDPNVDSYAGARGLMQMTEDTFDWIKLKIAPYEEVTYDDMYEPNTNIRFGSYFLKLSLDKYDEDISTAAAAYHSGWGWVDSLLQKEEYCSGTGQYLAHFPQDKMGHYVYKINKNYNNYNKLYTNTV